MSTPIYIRSPRVIEVIGTVGDETKVELFIFNSPASAPATPTYTLEKPIPSSVTDRTTFDISPFIKASIKHISFTEVAAVSAMPVNDYCYCYVKVYLNGVLEGAGTYTHEYICFDGFGYHEEGMNPAVPTSLMTEGSYQTEETNGLGNISVINDSFGMEARWTNLVSAVVTTTFLPNEVNVMPNVLPADVADGAKLEILDGGIVQSTYIFKPTCEHKYTTFKCDFINKFGAWQRIVFFKASKESISMKAKEYNLMPSSIDYNVQDNVRKAFNINASKSVSVNTGWVDESFGETITQLLLSETVRLDGKPVLVKTKSLELQKSINSHNINYKIQFNYAHGVLNYTI